MKLFEAKTEGDLTRKIYADDDGNVVIQKTQDHTAWMDRNRSIRDASTGYESLRHIGFIPDYLIAEWKKEGIDVFNKEDMPKVIAKLSSSEFHKLRSTEGKI